MACSSYEYVKSFELPQSDCLLPLSWMVVRVDGNHFSALTKTHKFHKPNDIRGLQLMNECASNVMNSIGEAVLCQGMSDEFSFVFPPISNYLGRRKQKIISTIASLFTANFIILWDKHFPTSPLLPSSPPPTFDCRVVIYPSDSVMRDYLSWRQVDCHINNLYNWTFYTLIQKGGLSETAACERLRGTSSGDKNEILFSLGGVNYNEIPAIERKGTVGIWKFTEKNKTEGEGTEEGKDKSHGEEKIESPPSVSLRRELIFLHEDIIGDEFWKKNDGIIPHKNIQKNLKKQQNNNNKNKNKNIKEKDKEKEKDKGMDRNDNEDEGINKEYK